MEEGWEEGKKGQGKGVRGRRKARWRKGREEEDGLVRGRGRWAAEKEGEGE